MLEFKVRVKAKVGVRFWVMMLRLGFGLRLGLGLGVRLGFSGGAWI
jgi:hypothetical protein